MNLNFHILNFIMFCRYNDIFFFNWFFNQPKTSKNLSKLSILRRLLESFYLFISWIKARVLYYANNWIYTTNHKRIAVNYFWFVILSGIFGMVLATVIRLELAYPGVGIFAGDSLQYLSLATAHGVIMVFFMIIPLISGAFANFLLPTQLGVHDVAFPRLNSAAFWFLPGGLMMLGQLICLDRRYQRMNCFNIREAQSLLKKRFFYDLIASNDHHVLLHKTMIGLRFKTNDVTIIKPDSHNFTNFNLSLLPKFRTINLFKTDVTFYSNINSSTNYRIFFYTFINNNFLSKILNLILNLTYIFNECLILNFSTITFFFSNFLSFITVYNFITFFIYEFNLIINYIKHYSYYYLFLINKNIILLCQKYIKSYTFESTNTVYFIWFFDSTERFTIKKSILLNSSNFFSSIFTISFFQPYTHALFLIINNLIQLCLNCVNFIKLTQFNQFENFKFNLIDFKNYQWQIQIYKQLNLNPLFSFSDTFFSFNFTLSFFNKDILASINNSAHDYWASTSVVIRNSIKELLNFFTNEKTFVIFWLKHRDYSNFLSHWYVPTITNNDELKLKRLFIENFGFNNFNQILVLKFKNLASKFLIFHNYFNVNYTFLLVIFFSIWRQFESFLINCTLLFHIIKSPKIYFLNIHEILILISNIFENYYTKIKNFFWTNSINSANLSNSAKISFKNEQLYIQKETLLHYRGLRFDSPVFAYDYKTGNYFPKFYQDNLTYLLSTLGKLTGGVRTSTWFLSNGTNDTFEKNIKSFFDEKTNEKISKILNVDRRLENRTNPTFFFYSFFDKLKNKNFNQSYKRINFTNLTEKFEILFTQSSMQERLYSNWRQLKFTREAWRCKLLIARHQKSLFRRYIHENGVFWSIERNARDLLPGWAMITPFSSRSRFTAIGKVDIGVSAIILVLISSIVSGANFLVTYRYLSTLNNRKMRDARSFFTEGIMCSSWMMIAANPMLIIGLIMLLCDRHWQTSFFDYSGGGDTILFQHMFWFFGHPEVYIVIIPTFGFVNTLFSYYLKKRISARASLLYSIYTIAFLGFFVWGHHMYMVGLSHTTRMLFSTLTVMISVPAATKLMHWCVTLVNSSFTVELPFLFMLTYVFLFVSGGISGMCVAHTGMDILFHDTFYVIGHFHVMFAGAAMFGSFGAFYFYFSAIFGVKYSRVYAYMHFVYYLLGQLLTVIPMFWLGYAGMPRRVLDYPSAFGGWHSIITAGHMLSVAGLIAFFMMIFDSLRQSRAATRTNLGIIRYNTRINFYFYETSRLCFVQQKGSYLYRYFRPTAFKLNGFHYSNYEYLETTLFSYTLNKKI